MKKRLFYLDFIKAIACWAVLTVHFNAQTSAMFTLPNKIFPNYIFRGVYLGTFGVSLFFIASGVGLYYSYSNEKQHSIRCFYWKRARALYPMFWIAWIGAAIVCLFVFKKISMASLKYFPLTILGMDGYLQGLGLVVGKFYLVGEWFLGCILLMYLVAPLLLYGVHHSPLFTTIIVILGDFSCLIPFMPGFVNNELWVMRRLPEVVLGMLFAKYVRNPNWKTSLTGCAIGIVGLSVANILPDKVTYDTIICAAAFLVLAGVAEYVRRGFTERLISNISKYSYAIFLCHHYIIYCAVQYLQLDWLQRRDLVVLYIAYIAATAFVSTQLYRAEKIVCHVVSEGEHGLPIQAETPSSTVS